MMTFQIPDRRIHKQRLGRPESYVVLLEKGRSLFPLNRELTASVVQANEDLFSHSRRISVAGMSGFQIVENSGPAGRLCVMDVAIGVSRTSHYL